jgi:hypothetical protein
MYPLLEGFKTAATYSILKNALKFNLHVFPKFGLIILISTIFYFYDFFCNSTADQMT